MILRLRRSWRIAWALLASQYALMLEYRAEIALWALSGMLPLIMLGVWQGSGAGAAAGLNSQAIGRYFLSAFVVRQFTVVWLIHVFEEEALRGSYHPSCCSRFIHSGDILLPMLPSRPPACHSCW